MRAPSFWVVIYAANLLAFVGMLRLLDEGLPLVLLCFMGAACGACQTGLERALELRRKGEGS